MKYLPGPDIQKLFNTTSPPSDLICWINFSLYNESKIDRRNINSNIDVGYYYKVVVEYNQYAQSHKKPA